MGCLSYNNEIANKEFSFLNFNIFRILKRLLVTILFLNVFTVSFGQTTGDFRSRQSGNWNDARTWEYYNGSSWIRANTFDFPNVVGTATSAKTSITGTTHTVSLPSGIEAGDLLLIFWADATNVATAPNTPSGWTQLYSDNSNGGYFRICWYKVADGSEGVSIDITAGEERSAHSSYRIAATTFQGSPFAGTAASGNNQNPDPPSLTSGFGNVNTLWIASAHSSGDNSNINAPNNYGNLINGTTGTGTPANQYARILTARRNRNAATEDPGTFNSYDKNRQWAANTVAIRGATVTGLPSNTSGAITVRNGHTVTISASVSADQCTIEAGGQVSVNSGQTLTINNGNGTDLTVNGTLYNSGTVTNNGTITFNSGSTYNHARNGGTIPTATWNTNSTCLITGITSTEPIFGAQNFGNLVYNSPGRGGPYNLGTTSFNINGNFQITNTGGNNQLYMNFTPLNISKDLIIDGGNFSLSGSATPRTINIGGNLVMSNGSLIPGSGNNSAGTETVNVTGNVTISGGTLDLAQNTGIGIINIQGNFSHTGGTVTETSSATGNSINFTGSSAQTYSSTGTSNTINYTVNNSQGVSLLSNMTVNSGATLTLTLGRITLNGNNLTVNNNVAGTMNSSNMVAFDSNGGNFIRNFTATGTYLLPVGSLSPLVYSPAQIAVNTGSSGAITTNLINNQILYPDYDSYLSRRWTITGTGITNYNITCTYGGGDIVGTEADLIGAKYDTEWVFYNPVVAASHQFTISGLTSFSSFSAAAGKPKVTAAADPTTVCSGGTVNLSATVKNGKSPIVYSWTSNPAGFTSSAQNPTANPTVTTTYTITVTDADGKTDSDDITVTVNPLPSAPGGTGGSRCGTGTVNISATPGAGETIDWYDASSGGNLLLSGNTNYTTPSISVTTSYYAEARNTTTGCVSSTRTGVVATVNSIPSAPGGTGGSRCGTGTVNISATPGAGETIDWYDASSGGNLLLSGNTNYTTPSISVTTSYYAEARNTTTGCVSSTRTGVVATVNSIPSAPGGTGGSRCGTGTVNISATPGAGETIDWYDASSGGNLLLSGNTNYTTPSISITTSYYAEARNTTTGCVSSTRTEVVATVIPIPATPSAGNNGPICEGSTLNLTASTISGAAYSWTGPNGFTSTDQNPSIVSATTAATGTYSVTATVGGCTSVAGTTNATVNPLPQGSISGNTICAGGTGQFTFSSTSGTGPFTLVINGTPYSGVSSGTPFNANPNPSSTTNYTLSSVTDANGCVRISGFTVSSATITLNNVSGGETSADQTVCSGGDPSTINVINDSGSGLLSYRWESSTTNCTTGFSDIGITTSSYNPPVLTQTTYYRRATISTLNEVACESYSTCFTATVNPIPTVIISNITQAIGNDSVTYIGSGGDICPELDPDQDFNPESEHYEEGYTLVRFRIDKGSFSGNWRFGYLVNGSNVNVISTTLAGDNSTPYLAAGEINCTDNEKVYIGFKVENLQNTTVNLNFLFIRVVDFNECSHVYMSNNFQTIDPMPAVGSFN